MVHQLPKVPLIGLQLSGGNHVLIDRSDRRSQLKTFKEATGYLSSGVPIMAFPEGGRSPTGRLGSFKSGVFSMAVRTGVPIIPVTICNAHAVMPTGYMFPVQPGEGKVRIVVHEKVEVGGRKEEDIKMEVWERIKSALPEGQMPEGEGE
jgi:1-acyl-sn-glycerol-3-phosphate acyltransferase